MPQFKIIFCFTWLILAMGALVIPPPSDASEDGQRIQKPGGGGPSAPLDSILGYISSSWESLGRSLDNCKTYEDVKTDGEPILYFPADVAIPPALREALDRCSVRLEHLPWKISKIGEHDLEESQPEGLLFLPHPYVVPGGQFNEMYGWDSYFIIRGLLRDDRLDLAKEMVENFFFEIENYGGVLNANRTYYLTRSQPPFLSSMVLAVHEAQKNRGKSDMAWLERAYGYVVRDYEQWNQPPHLAGETGLSRYFDHGQGPVPEILGDPSHYYQEAADYFLTHEGIGSPHLMVVDGRTPQSDILGSTYPVSSCGPKPNESDSQRCAHSDRVALTAEYYKGDRSMRESGFDVTFRFGPFGEETHHYAAVCLNSLLYKTETDLEKMALLLGKEEDARNWRNKALQRKELIVKYLWDSRRGQFFDFDFTTGKRSNYEYATTFYPLWAALASPEQARRVMQNLPLFEKPGGIEMSRHDPQTQWDSPYGWAPVHLLAVEGMRRYGYGQDGDRIAYKFLVTVLENFLRDGNIHEKYDVVTESSTTHIGEGYTQNVIGFGWTNGVFLELLNQLPPQLVARLKQAANSSSARSGTDPARTIHDGWNKNTAPGKESKP